MVNLEARKLCLISNPIRLLNRALSGCNGSNSASSTFVQQLLQLHHDKLRTCWDAYPSTSSASRSQINSGTVTLKDGEIINLTEVQKTIIFKISDTFQLDEIESLVIWQQFLHHRRHSHHPQPNALNRSIYINSTQNKNDDTLDEETLGALTAFYFEERQSVLIAIASMLHIGDNDDNESSPIFEICSDFLNSISIAEMPSAMLVNFSKRTKSVLPENIRASPRQAKFWAKQLIREQKLVLEVVFLLFYSRIKPHGSHYVSTLSAIKITTWGQHQESFAFFDEEASAIGVDIANLLTLIAIQVSHIEDVSSPDFVIPSTPAGNQELINPARLKDVYDLQMDLIQTYPQRAAPIALAWAFVLHKITISFKENGIPPAHVSFSELIFPENRTSNLENSDDNQQMEQSEDTLPLFQRWARHILSGECALFDSLSQLISSVCSSGAHKRFATPDHNALGYLVTIRALFSAIPLFFRLMYFSSQQFEDIINAFGLLFRLDHQHAIASEFWKAVQGGFEDISEGDIPLAFGEVEYLESARSRFPINVSLFTKMCRSLSAFSETRQLNATEDQQFCVQSLVEYVDNLSTLTEAIPNCQSNLLPLHYEPASPPDDPSSITDYTLGQDAGWVRATRDIWVSPSVHVPRDSLGKIVSGADQKPVVICWQHSWSAWQYWGDLVLHFAGYPFQRDSEMSGDDDLWSSVSAHPDWAAGKVDPNLIVEILQILTAVLESKPEAGSDLIRRMVSNASHQQFIQAVFNIVESSIYTVSQTSQTEATEAALRLVSALLPIFPGAIWTLIRGSSVLFPTLSQKTAWNQVDSANPLLNFERLSGRYGITLSALDTAHMLIFEANTSGLATPAGFAEIKIEVLIRALTWIRDEIWPGFQNWKYVDLAVKFKFATKCCRIFNAIASQALKTHLNLPNLKTDLVARDIIAFFAEAFITSPIAITLNPMIAMITTDAGVLDVLQRTHRIAELDALLESIFASLELAKNILTLRPYHLLGRQAGMLERLLLVQSVRKNVPTGELKDSIRQSALPFIAYWCLDGPNEGIAKSACELLSVMCQLSKDWPTDWPSISASFGDPADMSEFLFSLAYEGSLDGERDGSDLPPILWDLLATIVDTQSSLAAILITGKLSLPGWSASASEQLAADVHTKTADSALQIGIKTFVRCFQDEEAVNLAMGLSVLSFLDTAYGRVNEFESILRKSLENKEFTDRIVSIATSLIVTPQTLIDLKENRLSPMSLNPDSSTFGMIEELQVKHHCDELIARAYSTRILTFLLQLEDNCSKNNNQTREQSHPIENSLVQEMRKSNDSMTELIISTIESMADPELQSESLKEISNRAPDLDLDTYRRVDPIAPQDKVRNYGKSFVYDYEMMSYKIEGSGASPRVVDEVLKNLVAINWNLSVVDAQLEVTQAWQGLLEVALRKTSVSEQIRQPLCQSILSLSQKISAETREGEFMVNIHSVRISMLLTLIQALPVNSETTKTTIQLLEPLKNLISSDCFSVVESLKRRTKATWPIDLLKLVYVVLRRCTSVDPCKLNDEDRYIMMNTIESLFRTSLTILETVLVLVSLAADIAYEEELDLIVSIFAELLVSPVRPPTTHWTHRIHDFCQPAFSILHQRDKYDEQDPRLASDVIRLFMSMALDDRLAEYLASEGLIPALLDTPLTPKASLGLIEPVSSTRPLERSATHRLWCSILALVTSLADTLCHSEIFMVDEIASFAKLYSPQLIVALSAISSPDSAQCDYGMNLTLAGIEEMELVTDLLSIICSKPIGHPFLSLPDHFCSAMMSGLQTLSHCLNHPNSTSKWLENDVTRLVPLMSSTLVRQGTTERLMTSNNSNLDHNVQEALLHMLQISRNILQILISHTRAIHVLTRDVADWPLELTIINPTRSIVAGESVTIGTLFELAETSLEIYRLATGTTQPTIAKPFSSSRHAEAEISVRVVSEAVLEASLLLASTQLALWLHCPSHHPNASPTSATRSGKEMEMATYSHSWPRLKREIVTDLAPDLMSAIDKSLGTVRGVMTRMSGTTKVMNDQVRLIQNFRQSVSLKKTRPFVLREEKSDGSEKREKHVKKNGLQEVLVVLRMFGEQNLVSAGVLAGLGSG